MGLHRITQGCVSVVNRVCTQAVHQVYVNGVMPRYRVMRACIHPPVNLKSTELTRCFLFPES